MGTAFDVPGLVAQVTIVGLGMPGVSNRDVPSYRAHTETEEGQSAIHKNRSCRRLGYRAGPTRGRAGKILSSLVQS